MSQDELGQRIGRDKFFVSRIENGKTRLDTDTAFMVARALGVPVTEVLGASALHNGASVGFSDVAVPFTPAPGDPLEAECGEHRYPYIIDSDALENIGIKRGDKVIVDDSAAAVQGVAPLKPVLINKVNPNDRAKALVLPRQFVPPELAITNARRNDTPITLDGHDAYIFAVIVRVRRDV